MAKYEDLTNLAIRRSIFYPASEIYPNAPAGMYDYGPYGTAIKRKIIDLWRREIVQKEDFLEIDGAQIMPEDVFKNSGHLESFSDPITECSKCNAIFRADKLIEEKTKKAIPEAMRDIEYSKEIKKLKIVCPSCKGALSKVTRFNLMVKTAIGIKSKNNTYLRPETCQSIFLSFARMVKTMRLKLPKGIAQTGKAFRNEISPRQSILRTVEFTQMEAEIFFDPDHINDIENFNKVQNYKVNIIRVGKKKIESVSF